MNLGGMTLAQFLPIALQVSIGLIVFALGLETRPGDVTYLIRRPSLLARSLIAMNVAMPFLTAVVVGLLHLRNELKVALIVLAVSPVPPVLPGKQAKAGGNMSYAVGLLAISAVASIVTIPVTVAFIGRALGHEAVVPMSMIAKIVGSSVLGPLIAGDLIQRAAPSFAERAAKPVSIAGTAVLVLALLPVLLASWRTVIGEVGQGTLVAIVVFNVVGLTIGHLLGGPAPEDRTVLGLSTCSRHPGVAMAIANVVAQNPKGVAAAVLLCAIVGSLVTAPYVASRRRARAMSGTPTA